MSKFVREKMGGISDVIRCDEPNYLVWRWHPNGAKAGDLKRDTALRTNSVLRVKNGEVAVFVYKQKDGTMEDYIVGPHDETIKTKNFPILSSIIGLWYEGDTSFQAEVFFINLSQSIQIKFGVPYFNVVDPRFEDYEVPVAVRGTLTFKIEDYKAFVKNHQLATFDLEQLKVKVTDSVVRYIKDAVTNAPAENNIALIGIESKIDLINEKAEAGLKDRLNELFGVSVAGLDINAIEVDKESDGYAELKKVTKEVTARKVEAETLDYEEKLRIQREEGQYAQHMATKQTNLGAYETEVKRDVGVAGAEALGKMGEHGAGGIDMGSGHSGFNPMEIMAGMAVGGAIGQNIASTMNNSMNPNNSAVPPSLPKTTFHVAQNGQAVGPFEINQIKEMITSGQIKKDSLLWKSGTPTWERADSFDDLKTLFPPELPK